MKWQAFAVAALLSITATSHAAETKYGTGITDTEIKLGQTSPFSGAASAYSAMRLKRFNGETSELFGDTIGND
jgi:hypothetical protein